MAEEREGTGCVLLHAYNLHSPSSARHGAVGLERVSWSDWGGGSSQGFPGTSDASSSGELAHNPDKGSILSLLGLGEGISQQLLSN